MLAAGNAFLTVEEPAPGRHPEGGHGRYPYSEGWHLIVGIELYVAADESGVHGDPEYCLVSGYIGTPREWQRLEKQWREILTYFEVPDFHAKRFFGRDPKGKRVDCYRGWPRAKAMSFLNELLFSIDQRRLTPIGGAVHVPSFEALTYGERRFLTGGEFTDNGQWLTTGAPSKPYYIAMEHLIIEALKAASDDTRVHLRFDRQEVLSARAVQTFNEIVGKDRSAKRRGYHYDPTPGAEKLAGIEFRERPKEPSLQAADLLTHSWYSYISRGDAGTTGERRYAMERLTRKRDAIRVYNAEGLETVLRTLPAAVRQGLRDARL